ncbi:MAG: hypothetical protein ACOCTG_00465 [Bacteroidota bacterium]
MKFPELHAQYRHRDPLEKARKEDLERALRHYRRALTALSGESFQYLETSTADVVRRRLEAQMQQIVVELSGRRPEISQ